MNLNKLLNKQKEVLKLCVASTRAKLRNSGRLYTDFKYPHNNNTTIPSKFIAMDPWEVEYLFQVSRMCRTGIVEIGRFNGGSTLVLALANPDIAITSVDIAPQDDEKLKNVFAKFSVNNVNLIVGDSQNQKYNVGQYDMLFVDGDHSYQGCLNDLNNWWDELAPGGHVICHDCYFFNEVQDAVVDFTRSRDVKWILSPYIPRSHWFMPHGSLCHFQKPL